MDHTALTGHMDWLFRLALRLCRDTSDAQELTQETLLCALQSPAAPDNPQAWLATILRRRHADLLRRRYRLPTVCIDCVPEPSAPEPEDADLAADVRREVAFLAGKYREAIIRHYLLGEKVSDMALALEVPRGTVLSRLHAGREQMRKGLTHMEEYGKASYQPERLDVSCNGQPGLHDEPWSLVAGDLMKQNILIAAYDAPVTPVEIARHLGLNRSYLSKIFSKRTNTTIQNYIMDVRYEESKRYLSKGFSVIETAAACGYTDPSNFSKLFKAREGMSPKHWQKYYSAKIKTEYEIRKKAKK